MKTENCIIEMRQGKIVPSEESRDLIERFTNQRTLFPFLIGWDEIMPVVEKIESLGYTTHTIYLSQDKEHICNITIPGETNRHILVNGMSSKIEAVYQAVVEFIKWYQSLSTLPTKVETQK